MLKSLIPLIAAGVAAPAVAQDLPDDASIVVTASRVPQDSREVGQAVTVIDRTTIDARQTTVVSDLLATTPGVSVTRNGGLGSFTGVRIRGAEAEQTLVVIDGVRVNDPSSPGGGFDFANLLAGSVERIEVLRGPNAVPWGSQAIGGVVNIVTTTPEEGVQARARAEYGYADTLFASGGIAGKSGAVSGALNAGYLRSDGISAAADGSERDGYRQYGASGKLGVAIAPGVSVDLRGYWADSRVDLDGFPPPNYTFADTNEYSKTQEIYGYAGLNAAFGALHNRVAFTIADINRDNFDPSFGTEPSFIGRGRSERYEYQGDYRLSSAVRLVAGVERENTRFVDDSAVKRSTGVTSLWGEAIVKPITALTLTGGVRHDDHDAYGGQTTFGADAALALTRGTTLRASYGEGFKAPTLYQLYGAYGFGGLIPERARNVDIGIDQTALGGRLRASVTYFDRVTRNQIVFRSCSAAEQAVAGGICNARPFGVYDNIARTTARGVELGLALTPIDPLTFSANYTFIDAENRTPGADFGKPLARRPRQLANASVDYRLPFGLSLGATVSLVGDSFDDGGNFTRLDGYALASVRAELPIGDRFALYGRVENIADARYQTVAGYGTYGRAAYGGVRIKL
ncbi:TonB-dependent receptor [Sphingomonas sp. EC-HK361]|uniref:TonB-dependent receptor plug domain-containing protein n=1 Tax=Sphingomonas sp. EC-HK361 TaxID=2038397 RepID=UPI001251BBD2|nr:TonB-dependent receptor [Sphingomonas sp. EC-HK361]VVT02330.1 TonB-dependent receptor [Sphingomonas sp. EC-HK361]